MRYVFGALGLFLAATPIWGQDAPAPYVKLITAEMTQGQEERQFFGQVAARQSVDLAFLVGGQVVDFPVFEGQSIAKGEVVAVLDQEPFQLAYDQANLQKDQSDRALKRLQQLRGNAASQVSIEDASTAAQLAGIAARNAERSLEQSTLHAPFDALVATRYVENFTTVAAGTPVVRLHDMSEIRIEIDVPEVLFQVADKTDGEGVRLEAKFVASPDRYPLIVREFNAETSDVGQTFRMTLGMEPPEGIKVLPGSSVTVYAAREADHHQIAVPAASVLSDNDGQAQVMVFAPSSEDANFGTVRRVAVEITPAADGTMRVIRGLSGGEEIVASGAARLAEGQDVRRFTGFPN